MNLTDLEAIKCKTCGEPLDISKAQNGVIKCAICDSVFTLPKEKADPKVLDFLRQGEHELDTGRFEDAYSAFNKACELDKTEPEAYWGMALAEFKIQYLKDEVNNRLQPICHEVTDKDFSDSSNFLKAIRYATDEQKTEYERKAEEINYIKNEFYKIAKTGVKYDCFICVKVSDENGGRTQDYKHADDIYFELKGKGYKPFFSERELVGVTGADYEARILYALKSAECMLVICFDEAYLRTKWVKNEYTRFLKLVNDEEKESDSIALVFGNRPVEKLPGKKGKIQGIALNSLTAMERIVQFVDAHTPEARKRKDEALRKKEEEAKKKEKENEDLRNQLEELKQMFLNQQQQSKQEAEGKESVEPEKKEQKKAQKTELKEKKKENKEAIKEAKEDEERARLAEEQTRLNAEREKQERERKEKEEAEKKARQERARQAREIKRAQEKQQAEEQARIKAEQEKQDREQQEKDWKALGFEIVNGVLKKYSGSAVEVVIPDGVKAIDNWAFANCYRIISISIPTGVKIIGHYAFHSCSKLTSIELPNGVTSICSYAFSSCGALTTITIPNSVKEIGDNAFAKCSLLKSITIPSGVKNIGRGLFDGCKGLTDITIPRSVTSIDTGAFVNCTALTSITIPAGVKLIGEEAFSNCTGLTSIKIPGSVTEICKGAFLNCYGATDIVIPNSVKTIGGSAFGYCSSLKSITIPNSVTSIGKGAFIGCSGLKSIAVDVGNQKYKSVNNCLLTKDGKTLISGCKTSIIPDGVTGIADSAFLACRELTSINIPDSVENIGAGAFCNCSSLKSVIIPKRVAKIQSRAFEGIPVFTIYCRVRKQPKEWAEDWDRKEYRVGTRHIVLWKYKGM